MLSNSFFIISQLAYRETSLLLNILDSERGHIKIIAKGVRKNKKSKIDLFTIYHAQLFGRGELKSAAQFEVEQQFLLQAECLYVGLYINELIYYLVHSEDNNIIFKLYKQCLTALTLDNILPALRIFEHKLLAELGFGLDLTTDRNGKAIAIAKFYKFEPDKGGLCEAINSDTNSINGSTIYGLLNADTQVLASIDCKQFMRMRIDHALAGRKLRSRGLFNDIRNRA